MNTAVFGLMRGDEGKGKIVDHFSNDHDIIVRYAGGPNAGHTIYRNNKKIVLHQIPSGILNKKICVIGRGCVVDLKKLYIELRMIQEIFDDESFNIKEYVKLSKSAHVILQSYIKEDVERENSGRGNGSTKCGIAQAYRNKYNRNGLRVFDVFNNLDHIDIKNVFDDLTLNEINYLKDIIIIDDELFLNQNCGYSNILFEGAQGTLLDIDSPYYPNVSSSSPGIGGILIGTGINAKNLFKNFNAIGVAKIYMSSVGVGKFLTELNDQDGELIREAGQEYGATTGRPRKVGWFDLPLLNYSITTSGINELCITRFDTLSEAMKNKGFFKICTFYKKDGKLFNHADIWNLNDYEPVYESFPIWTKTSFDDKNFSFFISYLKNYFNTYTTCKLKYISVGKNKDDILKID